MKISNTIKIAAVIAAVTVLLVGVAYAASYWVAANNSINGTPLDPLPTPTPTPTATPTPTPTATPEPQVIGGYLTANDTQGDAYIFYKGDTLQIVVHLNQTVQGVNVRLYNNGNLIATAASNAEGKAVFERVVNNPYNYTATIENVV